MFLSAADVKAAPGGIKPATEPVMRILIAEDNDIFRQLITEVLTGAGHVALERGRTWNRRPAPWGVLAMIIGVAAGLLVFFLLRSPVPVGP